MEKEKRETAALRGTRRPVSRTAKPYREIMEEKSSSNKATKSPTEPSKIEPSERGRGRVRNVIRGSRIVRRGQNRQGQRRNYRMRQPNRNGGRLERAQNARWMPPRGRFRARRRFFGMRRQFGRRSIFIAGLPKNVTESRFSEILKKEGELIRCTLLKDRFGESRGIAFAEMGNPREALKVIQVWNGRNVEGNQIYVTFKRNPIRNRYNYSGYNNRFGNNRPFNRFGGYNNRFQRSRGGRGIRGGRGGRGRGRGF